MHHNGYDLGKRSGPLTDRERAAIARVEAVAQRLQMQANPLAFREPVDEPPATMPTRERTRDKRAPYGMSHAPIKIDGRLQSVTRVKTTIDVLLERGHIDVHLRMSFERFCFDIARSIGASGVDEQSADQVVIARGFGPKSISIRQLEGTRIGREVWLLIPDGLRALFKQLVAEEVGIYIEEGVHPPKHWGHAIGRRSEKQAIAAGDTMIRDLLLIVANYYDRELKVSAVHGGRY